MDTILLALLTSITFATLFRFLKPKFSKHQYNIKQSKRIIEKLNQFKYDGQKINYLKNIDPFVFEELLLTAFQKKGFKIHRNKKYTGDNGVDGTIYDHQNNQILIQAKRYKNYINKQHIQDFGNLIHAKKCQGFFIHTGKTGKYSHQLAQELNIQIISGSKLINLISNN